MLRLAGESQLVKRRENGTMVIQIGGLVVAVADKGKTPRRNWIGPTICLVAARRIPMMSSVVYIMLPLRKIIQICLGRKGGVKRIFGMRQH